MSGVWDKYPKYCATDELSYSPVLCFSEHLNVQYEVESLLNGQTEKNKLEMLPKAESWELRVQMTALTYIVDLYLVFLQPILAL